MGLVWEVKNLFSPTPLPEGIPRSYIEDRKDERWFLTEINEDEKKVILRKPARSSTFWHIVVLVFFGWWTLGLANLAYEHMQRFQRAEYKVLRPRDFDEDVYEPEDLETPDEEEVTIDEDDSFGERVEKISKKRQSRRR